MVPRLRAVRQELPQTAVAANDHILPRDREAWAATISSLNDHDIRYFYNSSIAKFTLSEANKTAASLAKKSSTYGSRPLGNFYVTLGTNKSVLFFMQDVETKATNYVAVKFDGSRFFALTPSGKADANSNSLMARQRASPPRSAARGSVSPSVTPCNDGTWGEERPAVPTPLIPERVRTRGKSCAGGASKL